MEYHNLGDHPDGHRRGGVPHRMRKARGGAAREEKTKEKVYPITGAGSPFEKEAEEERDEFRKGGKAKRAHGGHADGEHARSRPDRAPRGKRAKGGAVHDHDGHHHGDHHGPQGGHDAPKRGDHHGDHHGDQHGHKVEHHGDHHEPVVHHHGDGDVVMHPKRAAGGAVRGSNPFSTGHRGKPRDDSGSPEARGLEGAKVPEEPD